MDFSILDITGDSIFNGLDLVIAVAVITFWFIFYEISLREKIDFKKELEEVNVAYVNPKKLIQELDEFQSQIYKDD